MNESAIVTLIPVLVFIAGAAIALGAVLVRMWSTQNRHGERLNAGDTRMDSIESELTRERDRSAAFQSDVTAKFATILERIDWVRDAIQKRV